MVETPRTTLSDGTQVYPEHRDSSRERAAVEIVRCTATVWKRDCLRRTGRGSTGFEMHYNKKQCERAAVEDHRCWQHRDRNRFSLDTIYFRTLKK